MNKIPAISWMKMIAIVSIHLCIVGSIVYYYRAPVISCASIGWEYVTDAYNSCASYASNAWDKMPSPQQLVDGFIGILKLEPFK